MFRVYFENVGRDKLTWDCYVTKLNEPNLRLAIHAKAALRSHDISFDWDFIECTGRVYVGFGRPVGTFRWSPIEDDAKSRSR